MTTVREIAEASALLKAEYDNFIIDQARLALWKRAFAPYPDGVLLSAVDLHMRRSKFAPQMAELLELCDRRHGGGWLSSEEAWALVPRDESQSALITREIAEALATAKQSGDRVAARMAFKEAYERLTEQARMEGRQPQFFLSAGTDPYGCVVALAKGVQTRQISLQRAADLKPELAEDVARMCSTSIDGRPMLAGPDQAVAQKLLAGPSDTGRKAVKALLADLRAMKVSA